LNLHIGDILNKKIIFSLFLSIGFIAVYGQVIPQEFYESFQLYKNNSSNNEIALSADKFIYKPGEYGDLVGFVSIYERGERVYITIIRPDGSKVSEFSISPSSEGFFTINHQFPPEYYPGKYKLDAKYTPLGKSARILFTLQPEESGKGHVDIPSLAEIEDSGQNFSPNIIEVNANEQIIWKNNDETIHTVVSAVVGFNKKMFSDGKFDSGTFGPGDTFSIFLPQGEYDYFCKLHPWLIGSIIVNPSTDPDYVPPVLGSIEPVDEKPILNDGYVILKTDREFYFKDQKVTLLGSVLQREGDLPVAIQIFGPTGNLITIDQITPNLDKNFIKSIPLSGNLFNKYGQYKIVGQYGILEHKTEISFFIESPKIVESDYKGYTIHQFSTFFLAIPNPEGSIKMAYKNFLANPSFEEIALEDDKIPGWSNPTQYFTWHLDDENVNSGKYSLKVSTNSTDRIWSYIISDDINVMPGDIYLLETNTKQNNAIESHISIWGKFSNDESNEEILLNLPFIEESNIWIKYKKELTIPDGVTQIKFFLQAGGVQDPNMGKSVTWFDDIKARQIGSVNIRAPIEGSTLDDVKSKIDNSPPGPYFFDLYDGYSIFLFNGIFYAILGNFDDLEPTVLQPGSGLMAKNTLENLFAAIDKPLSPIPKEVYLEIWNERPDLQSLYPEVKFGNFWKFREWAVTEGWKDDPRLAVFAQIEEDEITPDIVVDIPTAVIEPEEPTGDGIILFLQIIVVVIAIGIGGYYFYRIFYLKNQPSV